MKIVYKKNQTRFLKSNRDRRVNLSEIEILVNNDNSDIEKS